MLLITSKLNAVEEEEKGWKKIFLTTFVMEIEQTITKKKQILRSLSIPHCFFTPINFFAY